MRTSRITSAALAGSIAIAGAARAQPVEPCSPRDCPAEAARPAEPPVSTGAVITIVAGFVFEGVAQAITVAHVASGGTPSRIYDLVPVVGPIGVAARDPVGAEWGTALVFAACAQAIGALTLALGVRDLYSPWGDLRIGVSLVPAGGAMGLSGHF